MGAWPLKNQIEMTDIITEMAVFIVAVTFLIALIKLYTVYGKPRIMRIMLFGIGMFTVGALLNLLDDIFQLPWLMRYVILNFFDAAGALFSALGITLVVSHLFELAKIDSLTGLYNRRFFKEILNMEVARSKRNNLVFCLLFLDLDNFKQVYDNMGHALGDVVLRRVAQELKSKVRISDVVARWGGDEFIILFPQTDSATAHVLSERLVESIKCLGINELQFGISIGIVSYPKDGDNVDRLLDLADQRMYQNKKGCG